jgi:hypothetical protein
MPYMISGACSDEESHQQHQDKAALVPVLRLVLAPDGLMMTFRHTKQVHSNMPDCRVYLLPSVQVAEL